MFRFTTSHVDFQTRLGERSSTMRARGQVAVIMPERRIVEFVDVGLVDAAFDELHVAFGRLRQKSALTPWFQLFALEEQFLKERGGVGGGESEYTK